MDTSAQDLVVLLTQARKGIHQAQIEVARAQDLMARAKEALARAQAVTGLEEDEVARQHKLIGSHKIRK